MEVNRSARIGKPGAGPHRRTAKLGRPRLLIVGCGDIGLRIVARLNDRFRIVALTSNPTRTARLRAAGTVPIVGNLDNRRTLARLAAFGARVIHLAPPTDAGTGDRRTANLVAVLKPATGDRTVYISTTGVYGDYAGAWIDETARLKTTEPRSERRVAAEELLRRRRRALVLRVPGIYARDRLPLDRLRNRLPALAAQDDVYTSHIYADDLARIAIAALARGRPCRVVNTVDDSALKMGEYFDLVADHAGLPRPPRLPRDELRRVTSPMMWSFLAASRRIRNDRLKRELRVRLLHPTVAVALAAEKMK
jgi:nucleoside-diphosphate-sugar epimerase